MKCIRGRLLALLLSVVLSSYGQEEEIFAPVTVHIRLRKDELVPYVHPGGPILDEQLRNFCKDQLKNEMDKKGIDASKEKTDPLFGLMENIWVTCRNTLRQNLPAALRSAASSPNAQENPTSARQNPDL
uniref:Uncharacterized protein n=1 Tax=Aureoumbra lagunensis TaxID=44058 RepID=A0A7S3K317_9STRA|mmetsp:Transcript_7735/g.10771  ORF Transcript_7735/g.10771 Transcript_7735/m.10771 type:complete len:129 (-) Transcript_7735:558-944(-)